MSVLFKALQKAEKENEQRQTSSGGAGFDAGRLAGSGAIKLAGGQGINWRTAGLAAAVVLAVAIAGAFFLIQTPETPTAKIAAAKPSTVTPVAPGTTEAIPVLQPPANAETVAATPQQATPAPPPAEAMMAAAPAAANSSAAVSPPPAASSAPPVAAPAAASAPAAPQAAAPVAVAPVAEPPVAAPAEKPAATQVAKTVPTVPKPPAASVAPQPRRDPAADIAVDSPARMLSPPIAIHRAEFELSGVGKAVQVREVSQSAQDNVGAGYNALVRGAYDMALLDSYDRALKAEPTSVLALLGHGAALQKLGKSDEARADYERVLKLDPANREALSNLTVIVGERSSAEALNQLLDLEKQYPGFSPVKAQIGLTYAKLGSMDQAFDYLSRAVTMTPEAVMYQYNLALVLDHLGRADQAVSVYQAVLDSLASGRGAPELSAADIERRVHYLKAR